MDGAFVLLLRIMLASAVHGGPGGAVEGKELYDACEGGLLASSS